jgi:hypothetical protein
MMMMKLYYPCSINPFQTVVVVLAITAVNIPLQAAIAKAASVLLVVLAVAIVV